MILFDDSDNRCYITDSPSVNTEKEDIVHVVGYQKIDIGEAYPKSGFPDVCLFKEHGGRYINEYQIIYIASGSGSFQDRGIHYKVNAGDFLLIQPGFWHSYSPNRDTGWEEYYFGFNGPTLSNLARELYMINEINLLKIQNRDFVLPIYAAALKIGKENSRESISLMNALLTQLITYARFSLNKILPANESFLFRARQYMEKNLARKITLEDIANHLCVSNSWFRKEFLKETGVPPATFLGRIRLQTSKYLLLSSSKSIKEISKECGFTTSEYFCKFFRDNTGLTPSEFRSQNGPATK
jgi:AraC-like DNA-binding protein